MISEIELDHIESAIAEFDASDRRTMLKTYKFKPATGYLVRRRGKFYDPKALIGVAHKYAAGEPLAYDTFVTDDARSRLRTLGVDVVEFRGLWWVNQGGSFKDECSGGYLWASEVTSDGRTLKHWSNVERLRPGQMVIHNAYGKIVAIGRVAGKPGKGPNPSGALPSSDGFVCAVDYHVLNEPIARQELPDSVTAASPFDRNGKTKEQYLNEIEDDYTLAFLEFLDARIPDLFAFEPTHRSTYVPPSSSEPAPVENPILDALLTFRNVVLEGVPGTGKTYALQQIANHWTSRTRRKLLQIDGQDFATMVMHPSSSYEDFVEGLRPTGPAPQTVRYFDEDPPASTGFAVADGFFVDVCRRASANPDKDVLVLIDELNRCNIPSVFGDLLLTLEPSKRASYSGRTSDGDATASQWHAKTTARLPYSGRIFFVPDNVYVVATTNTTDRSVAPLDAALRRRFAFHRIEPALTTVTLPGHITEEVRTLFQDGADALHAVNEAALRPALGPDSLLGHSYLHAIADTLSTNTGHDPLTTMSRHWRFTILPQLIDSTRSFNAEDLLDPLARATWFDHHPEVDPDTREAAVEALSRLDDYLTESIGVRLAVEGIGLSRGARVVDA
ncbi:McrB family protein [Rhodococcus sp. NPDC004095]